MSDDLITRGDAWEPPYTPVTEEDGEDAYWSDGGQGRPHQIQTREDVRRHPPLPLGRPSRPPQADRALDKNTNSVSQSDRELRFALRDGLREITTIPRVAKCGHILVDRLPSVHLVKDQEGRTRYQGVLTCGSIWICPECSARLGAHRAKKLSHYVTAWMRSGKQVLFLTLTMPHDYADGLEASASTIQKAFTRILSGRRWQQSRAKYGIQGFVRALEVTLGESGWHPHMHVLLFLERRLSRTELEALHAFVFDVHAQFVTKAGFRAPDIRNCPLKIVAHERVGEYVGKVAAAHELTSSHTKQARRGGRTPFQLLADALEHREPADLARWHEWEEVMHGRRQLTWSRGLETSLRAMAADLIEEERQKREVTPVAFISRPLWTRIRSTPRLSARLLDVVECYGYQAGLELLRRAVGKEFNDLAWSHFISAEPTNNEAGPP